MSGSGVLSPLEVDEEDVVEDDVVEDDVVEDDVDEETSVFSKQEHKINEQSRIKDKT